MKTWGLIGIFLILIGQALALTPEERMRARIRMREEMHQKLQQSLLQGGDPTATLNDLSQLMDSMMEESMQDMQDLSRMAPSNGTSSLLGFNRRSYFSTEWTETKEGRSLLVKPADKDTKLDVQVNGQVISIKMEVAQKSNGSSMTGQSVQTQLVPNDCDGDQVKMQAQDNGLVLFFPYKGSSQKEKDRTPIQGKANDIQT